MSDRSRGEAAGIARLAGELLELARRSPDELVARVATLTIPEQAELALRLRPAERLELLLHAPRPMRLVRALPDADLYLTVREIGPADAMPLLSLASVAQLTHLLDLESWRGDRFDADRAGAWVALFLESGEPSARRFLRHADDELLALLFQKWVRVEQIEFEDGAEKHGHGEGESGTERGGLTPDGHHRFAPSIPEHLAAVRRILQLLYTEQPERYQRALWGALWELPSDLEEQALRWRQSRLEQHGFPDWESALAVYAAPQGVAERPAPPRPADRDGLAASRGFLMVLPAGAGLVPAVDRLSDELRERVLFELVSVANRLLVADAADTGDPAAHRAAIEKAAGYIAIALERRGAGGAAAASEALEVAPVLELFREGYGRALELQDRAAALLREGWAARHPRAVELLDSPVRERLQALLRPRPLYVDLAAEDGRAYYRDFGSAGELEQTRVAVETADTLGRLFLEHLGLDLDRLLGENPSRSFRFSTLLLTLLAWHATRQELRGDPLPREVVADFLRTVASRRTAGPDAAPRALERLVAALVAAYELAGREASVLHAFGRFCLEKLADECGGLDPGVPVDSSSVPSLILARGRTDEPALE